MRFAVHIIVRMGGGGQALDLEAVLTLITLAQPGAVGLLAGSGTVFCVTLPVLVGLAVVSGDIRLTKPGR